MISNGNTSQLSKDKSQLLYMYEIVTSCPGPLCTYYTVKIYNSKDVLITKASSHEKEKARRIALKELEIIRNNKAEILPVSSNSRCKLDPI